MSRLIYAEYLLDLIKDIDSERFGYIDAEDINNAPTVDAVPVKHGYWKHSFGGFVECSNCGDSPLLDGERKYVESEYCPCCGAKMDAFANDINVSCKSDEVTKS